MIGIVQLDNLSSEDILQIISGSLRIHIKDPRKIQTTVEDIPEPTLIEPDFMDDNTVITLLKMELESRAGWEYLRQKILEEK